MHRVQVEAEERVQAAKRTAAEDIERVREEVAWLMEAELGNLRTDLDAAVRQKREVAEEAARRAQSSLAAADKAEAHARDVSSRAALAAERAANDAARTAERLRWDRTTAEAVSTAGEADLVERTKAELLELAAAAEIPGRSAMTKDELIDALLDL